MIRVNRHRSSSAGARAAVTHALGQEPLDEGMFIRMLCLERKRTERSGARFVLMLLQWSDLVRQGKDERTRKAVLSVLMNSVRETDIKGWYKNNAVFGIIFTEVGAADGKVVAGALLRRVTDALSATLSIDEIQRVGLSFHVFPDELASQGLPDLALYPDAEPGGDGQRTERRLKRAVDIGGSLLGLVVLSPLLILIALSIKITSRGPVLFRQQRVGRYGARFTFLKFRSMYVASDESIHKDYVTRLITRNAASEDCAPVFKIRNDPRVTRVGRILRRSSLDELPQLLNVLRGEMSLVGPRPPVLYEYSCYNTWHRRRVLMVKPGITGLWQVQGRSRVSFDDMVRLDLRYAEQWSLWLDLKILWKTPAAVFSGEGAY